MLSTTKRILTASWVVGILLLAVFLPATASAGGTETCTTGECKFMPATFVPEAVVVETSHSHGSSSKTISIKKIKKWKHKFEKRKHVRVVVYEKENGVHGAGCVKPTQMGWDFHVGDTFINTNGGVPFWDHWKSGIEICDWHIITWKGHKWAEGTKSNCGNANIKIPIHFHVKKVRIKKTIEVKSYAAFYLKFMKHVHITSESTSESENVVTRGHYTCQAGWELVGTTCKNCPAPHCVPHPCEYGSVWNGTECVKDGNTTPPPPTEAPGPNPPDEGPVGSNQCYDEITGAPVPPRSDGTCPAGSYGAY